MNVLAKAPCAGSAFGAERTSIGKLLFREDGSIGRREAPLSRRWFDRPLQFLMISLYDDSLSAAVERDFVSFHLVSFSSERTRPGLIFRTANGREGV